MSTLLYICSITSPKPSTIFALYLYIVNSKFADSKISFDVELLPTTIHNRKELMDFYLKGAQYGYSKIYTGVV